MKEDLGRPVGDHDRGRQGRLGQEPDVPWRPGLSGRHGRDGRRLRRLPDRSRRLRRLRYHRAVDRLRRTQGRQPQGQDRPPAQRCARPGQSPVAVPGQEGAQGQVLPGGAPGRHDGHDDARGGPQRFNKLTEIAKLGPAAIVQVSDTGKDSAIFNALSMVRKPGDERPIVNKPRRRLSIAGDTGSAMGPGGAQATQITREMANLLLEGTGQTIDDLKKKIESTMKPASMDIPGAKMTIATTAKTALVRGTNVLGVIEGSDPKLKDEYFVVGGHYDHLGMWEEYIYNGADDNGSGSVGVLNIAKAMAASPVKPKRSIVFALWTGEEEGLLGSRYYVQNPAVPDRQDGRLPQLRYDQPAVRRRIPRPRACGPITSPAPKSWSRRSAPPGS